jgi:hypothetical protein
MRYDRLAPQFSQVRGRMSRPLEAAMAASDIILGMTLVMMAVVLLAALLSQAFASA